MALSLGEERRGGVEEVHVARREEGIEEASPKFLVRQLGGGEGQLSDGSDRERAVVVGDSREVLPVVDRDPEGAPPVVAGPFGEPGEPGYSRSASTRSSE